MRPLNAEELSLITNMGKGRFTLLYAKITELNVGEGLLIEPKDWKTKSPPYRVIKNVIQNTNRTFAYGRMPNGSGWFVKRVS